MSTSGVVATTLDSQHQPAPLDATPQAGWAESWVSSTEIYPPRCLRCMLVPRDAAVIVDPEDGTTCGCLFCETCVTRGILWDSYLCSHHPLGRRVQLTSVRPDREARRVVLSLWVTCGNARGGCHFRGDLEDYCAHRVVCAQGELGLALWRAVEEDREDAVRSLVARRADLAIRGKMGETPLCFASMKGRETMVCALVGLRADPNAPTSHGLPPLSIASQHGHAAVVCALLELRADPEAADKCGMTALHWASACNHEPVVHALVHSGADPRRPSNASNTPIDFALAGGSSDLARSLRVLRSEASREKRDAPTDAEFAAASFLTPIRRFVLGKRLRLNVDPLNLADVCILSLLRSVSVGRKMRQNLRRILSDRLPHQMRDIVLRHMDNQALARSLRIYLEYEKAK